MRKVACAVIPGDGIGKEVVPEALRVLEAAAEIDGGIAFEFHEFAWGCEYYCRTGRMMPEDGLRTLAGFEVIFLGAVGFPGVPDHVSLWNLLIPIRRGFQQYVNLRPCRLLRGVTSPLRGREAGDIDLVIVRENTEGEYSQIGGLMYEGTPMEMAVQNAVFTRMGCERIIRYAFELSSQRRGAVTAATKSNGISITMPFWDRICRDVARDYPDVDLTISHVDALSAQLITRPQAFDVVVASNLFGDILSDIAGAIMGSLGMAPSANLNPERKYPSMFEPVHGSAPDIAGRGIANPIGQIWTAKLVLDFLGKNELGDLVLSSIEDTLADGVTTPDLGGSAGTRGVTDRILEHLRSRAERA
ncbi:MAG TPA: tartrate dehydrogenase [Bacillota bacterium]